MKYSTSVTACCLALVLIGVTAFHAEAQIMAESKISELVGDFEGQLDNGDRFGFSTAIIGDLDGDGVRELAVGAPEDDDGASRSGAVWILFLDDAGTVKRHQKISRSEGGGPPINSLDLFGSSVAWLGELAPSSPTPFALAVGAPNAASAIGRVWILFLNTDGTVQSHVEIGPNINGGPLVGFDPLFGWSVGLIGDLDNDNILDMIAGAPHDSSVETMAGAAYILFMNSNGTVASSVKIDATHVPGVVAGDQFGFSSASLGNEGGAGSYRLAVGANQGGVATNFGGVWILQVSSAGAVEDSLRITDGESGFPVGALAGGDNFGYTVASIEDLDEDGVDELAIGAITDSTAGNKVGAFWIVFLDSSGSVKQLPAPVRVTKDRAGFRGELSIEDQFGTVSTATALGTGGNPVIAAGAYRDDDGGPDRGAVWILTIGASCAIGAVNSNNGNTADVLLVNGSTGGLERRVKADASGLLWASILQPPVADSGEFAVVAYVSDIPGALSTGTNELLGAGESCFPLLLLGSMPAAVWTNLSKETAPATRTSVEFGEVSIPPPSLAPNIFFQRTSGDVNLPTGTAVTFQGVIADGGSGSPFRLSVTNAVVLEIE